MGLKSFIHLSFARYIIKKNAKWENNAIVVQNRLMLELVKKGKTTIFGKAHDFKNISSYVDFKNSIPITNYEGIKPYIEKIIAGKKNVLWPGRPIYFCKTSGTTSGSKYIPVTKASMPYHITSARDAIFSYILESKDSSVLNGKMIFLQGSPKLTKTGNILTGRLSGIVAHHIPYYLRKNRLPSYKANCIDSWEKKLDAIIEETISENMSLISGIPPWVKMYFEKIHEKTGCLIRDVFPNFNLFIYGGVNFSPYKKTFDDLIGKKLPSIELYPASEGFIAYQDSQTKKGLLLCVNHGIFYEFIKASEFFESTRSRISIADVELNVNYVLILNTNAGLWGYNIGDTIKFVSLDPYRIIVTGRLDHFTSAFGEHVITQEVERSLVLTLKEHSARITEFHVAPEVNPVQGLPYHEWFIEFEQEPADLGVFGATLDKHLGNQNSYYKDLINGRILKPLQITKVNAGGFKEYMGSIGKLGGQNKVPRLANDRVIVNKLH